MNGPLLAVGGIGIALIAVSTMHRQRLLVWNATASVPVGLYRVVAGQPTRGSLALINLPEPSRTLLHQRGYLRGSLPAIKPIVATRGDIVCRLGNVVYVNNRVVALARHTDHAARPLPRWRGCTHLGTASVAVISPHPDGFDSRYFGAIKVKAIIGLAIPVWTTDRVRLRTRR